MLDLFINHDFEVLWPNRICLSVWKLRSHLFIFVLLIVWRSDDVALQAGSHIRLFCGGGEIALVLFLLVIVENNKERLKFVKNRCSLKVR